MGTRGCEMSSQACLLQLKGISKSFSGIPVLQDVDLDIKPGEVHVLLGENGAGKSTLIKIMTGAYLKDEGEIWWKQQQVAIQGPKDAMKLGIATIYQELTLIPEMMVYENIFLGRELYHGGPFRILDRKRMIAEANQYLQQLGQLISPMTKVSALGIGQQQLVEIAKALSMKAELIIMDEPSSSLSENEIDQLLLTVNQLRKQGIAIVYISHKLEENKRIGDRVSILRDGKKIDTLSVPETDTDQMIQLMVGRNLEEKYPRHTLSKGEEGLRIENLRLMDSKHSISFTAYEGEIIGISGLVGAGRSELARGIFGVDPIEEGDIHVFGRKVSIRSPKDAIRAGLAFITEDRKGEGLVLDKELEFNMTLASLKRFKTSFWLSKRKLMASASEYMKKLQVRPGNVEAHARKLSGGNQQKVVIAKWLCTNAKVFIFDEPTRGIDVGAKVEVYRLINSLVEEGAIIIVISSELPEILGICDRILVMRDGALTGDMLLEKANQESIMKAATGGL